MSSLTIELPEPLSRQIKMKGVSQEKLQSILIQMIQVYLHEEPVLEEDHDISSGESIKTLLDLRGSISVSQPQDFYAIRQQVIQTQIQKRTPHAVSYDRKSDLFA